MPLLGRLMLFAAIPVVLSPVCLAQALVEYAAGAAIGTAGSAGGKAVSSGLDRIFKKTDAAAQKAAGTTPQTQPRKEQQRAAGNAKSAGTGSTASRPAAAKRGRPRVEGAVVSLTDTPAAPLPAYALEKPNSPTAAVSAEEFARITPGTSRQDLVTRVGSPSYRVRIQGDGHVQEIYRYSSNGVDLGSVRVVDGAVASVKIRNN